MSNHYKFENDATNNLKTVFGLTFDVYCKSRY